MDKKIIQKEFWDISKIKPYEKNPRVINKKDFELLKKHISELGQFKPVIINEEGVILGGNMRFRAMLELGIKEVWVSVVQTKSEAEIIKYNLIDNQRYGFYQEQELAELVFPFQNEIDLQDFSVDFLSANYSVLDSLNAVQPCNMPETIDVSDEQDKGSSYRGLLSGDWCHVSFGKEIAMMCPLSEIKKLTEKMKERIRELGWKEAGKEMVAFLMGKYGKK